MGQWIGTSLLGFWLGTVAIVVVEVKVDFAWTLKLKIFSIFY
jgi:hypothetical protein